MKQQWQERARPARLERKYEFSNYEELRDFLDKAADVSEKIGIYPNIGFGKDYANFTIYAEQDENQLSDQERELADTLEKLNDLARSTEALNQKETLAIS